MLFECLEYHHGWNCHSCYVETSQDCHGCTIFNISTIVNTVYSFSTEVTVLLLSQTYIITVSSQLQSCLGQFCRPHFFSPLFHKNLMEFLYWPQMFSQLRFSDWLSANPYQSEIRPPIPSGCRLFNIEVIFLFRSFSKSERSLANFCYCQTKT